MANGYTVLTFENADTNAWLENDGVVLPSDWDRSRYPSPSEIRATLGAMDGYKVDYLIAGQNWDANISQSTQTEPEPWASLVVLGFTGDETQPLHFYFTKGWRSVMVDVLN